jgi:hypothetical protein
MLGAVRERASLMTRRMQSPALHPLHSHGGRRCVYDGRPSQAADPAFLAAVAAEQEQRDQASGGGSGTHMYTPAEAVAAAADAAAHTGRVAASENKLMATVLAAQASTQWRLLEAEAVAHVAALTAAASTMVTALRRVVASVPVVRPPQQQCNVSALNALAKQWQQHVSEGLWVLRMELQLRCAASVHAVRAALQDAPHAVLQQADMQQCAADLASTVHGVTVAALPVSSAPPPLSPTWAPTRAACSEQTLSRQRARTSHTVSAWCAGAAPGARRVRGAGLRGGDGGGAAGAALVRDARLRARRARAAAAHVARAARAAGAVAAATRHRRRRGGGHAGASRTATTAAAHARVLSAAVASRACLVRPTATNTSTLNSRSAMCLTLLEGAALSHSCWCACAVAIGKHVRTGG